MVDLPSIPLTTPQVRVPQSPVSPGDIAQPYNDLARTLDKTGEVLMQDVAKPAAHAAGLQAVSRDQDGNVQVQRVPIFGDASPEFMRAVKFSAVADGEGELKRKDIELRQQFRDDPQGYAIAAEAFKKQTVENYTKIGGADVGLTLGKIIDGQTTLTYRGLLTEHERLTLQRADRSMEAGISDARDDLVAMARGGVTSGPAWDAAKDKFTTLTEQRVGNTRMAYPREQADYDTQHLEGELKANGFLHHIDQVYKDQSLDENGQPKGGTQAALTEAKSILTDTSIKITPQQREQFYHRAVAEVRANNAIRNQDLQELRAADLEYAQAISFGAKADPAVVDSLISKHYELNDPTGALRLQGMWAKKPLMDGFGKQPLGEMNRQLAQTAGIAPRANAAYSFFTGKGYSSAQASGIVGNLIQESNLNPNAVHDGGIGLGISGWNKERLDALKEFASARGTQPTDFQTQLEFVDHELRGREVLTGQRLKNAKTPEEAGAAMINYFRPAGWTPGNPERGDGFNNRVSNARTVFASAGEAGPAPTPAASLWLQQNRAYDVSDRAVKDWTQVVKDWKESKFTQVPNQQQIKDIGDAAHLSGNGGLSDRMANDLDLMNRVQAVSHLPLDQQNAIVTEYERKGAAGELDDLHANLLHAMSARRSAIETGLKDNPVSTAVANLPGLRTPPPLNVADSGQFRAGLAMRAQIAGIAASNWGTEALSAIDKKGDLEAVQATLEKADPATRARIFSDITAAIPDEKIRNATFGKLAEGGPKAATQAYAGALYGQAPDVAASILRGQHAMEVDTRYNPMHEGHGAGARDTFNTALDEVLPRDAFSLAGRTDPSGPYATMRSATIARYADLTAQNPAAKLDALDKPRLQQAANDVSGGIWDHNGGKAIMPQRGMLQATADRVLWGVTDQDLAGVTTLAGEPVTAAYLRGRAQLESYGDGRYLVRLGSDPMRPIYAVQNANTEMPQPFVLDLRGRKPSDQGPARGVAFEPYPRG